MTNCIAVPGHLKRLIQNELIETVLSVLQRFPFNTEIQQLGCQILFQVVHETGKAFNHVNCFLTQI